MRRDAATKPRRSIVIIALAGTLALPSTAGAQASSSVTGEQGDGRGSGSIEEGLLSTFSLGAERGPITIKARALEFDYRTRVLTYRGAVTVKQAGMTLRSDVLRVSLDHEGPERLREVVAEGGVVIAAGDRRATGGRAVFNQATRTVVLSDQARLQDGPNEVAGERVVVYLDEERSVVEGGEERVRAVLFPPGTGAEGIREGARDDRGQ